MGHSGQKISQNRGIRDWGQKFDALKVLFGVETNIELARAILGAKDRTKAVADLAQNFKNWHEHSPSGIHGTTFKNGLEKWLQEHGCSANNIKATIVGGDYEEFYALIPDNYRAGVPVPPVRGQSMDPSVPHDSLLHPMWIHRVSPLETAKDGLRRGQLDQKLCYLTPDSAEIWKALIDADGYKQYEECKDSLKQLVDSAEWKGFAASNSTEGVVILGAGAPTKDLMLIRSIVDCARDDACNYSLVDHSFYMLRSSYHAVRAGLEHLHISHAVDLHTFVLDFMSLREAKRKLRHSDRALAWILPGGTIGNLKEGDFFRSIASVARAGDLLIIGAETVNQDNVETIKRSLLGKYEIPEMRQFLSTPIRAIWQDLKGYGTIEEAAAAIRIDTVDGVAKGYSNVIGSVTVEMMLPLRDGSDNEIVAFFSSRYDTENFVNFAEAHEFSLIATFASEKNPRYKQFMFRFSP